VHFARLDAVQQKSGQVVFVLDSWAAQLDEYNGVFTEIDKPEHRSCPVLVPLNERDDENRQKRAQLLQAVANRLPGRAAMGGAALLSGINDESEFESQLARVLAARQSALIAATPTSGALSAQLPVI
jgi:FxsC-like protein